MLYGNVRCKIRTVRFVVACDHLGGNFVVFGTHSRLRFDECAFSCAAVVPENRENNSFSIESGKWRRCFFLSKVTLH